MTLIEKIKKIIYWDLLGALLSILLIYIFQIEIVTKIIDNKGFIFGYYGLLITIILGCLWLFFNFKDDMIMFLKGSEVYDNYRWHIYYNFKINLLGAIILLILLFIQKTYLFYFELFILTYSILAFIILIKMMSIIVYQQSQLRMIIKKNKIKY